MFTRKLIHYFNDKHWQDLGIHKTYKTGLVAYISWKDLGNLSLYSNSVKKSDCGNETRDAVKILFNQIYNWHARRTLFGRFLENGSLLLYTDWCFWWTHELFPGINRFLLQWWNVLCRGPWLLFRGFGDPFLRWHVQQCQLFRVLVKTTTK